MRLLFPAFRLITTPFTAIKRSISTKDFPAYKSLEADEITRIKKSWVVVTENESRFIDILHNDMICNIQMYELYFNPTKKPGVCVSELPEFQCHPRHVYSSLDNIVSELDNENVIVAKMIDIGKRHGKLGVSKKHIGFMTSVIYQAVECTVGRCAFDRLVDMAWEKFLTSFNDVVASSAVRDCSPPK